MLSGHSEENRTEKHDGNGEHGEGFVKSSKSTRTRKKSQSLSNLKEAISYFQDFPSAKTLKFRTFQSMNGCDMIQTKGGKRVIYIVWYMNDGCSPEFVVFSKNEDAIQEVSILLGRYDRIGICQRKILN